MRGPIALKRSICQISQSSEQAPGSNKRRCLRGRQISEIEIRLMKSCEIDKVLELCKRSLLEYASTAELRESTQRYHEMCAAKTARSWSKDCECGYAQFNRRVWVAVRGGELLGCIAIKPRPRKPLSSTEGVEVDHVAVTEGHRGTGLAQRLLRTVEDYCSSQGIRALYLTTQDNLTRAIRFYEKEGFQRMREKRWEAYVLLYYRKNLSD